MAESNTNEQSFICKTCGINQPSAHYRIGIKNGYTFRYHECRTCHRKRANQLGITKSCEQCGKNFKARKDRAYKIRYCSIRCFGDANTTTVEIICAGCGKAFAIQRCHIGRIFKCKAGCGGGKITKTCKRCGNPFQVYPYRKKDAIYCGIRSKCPAGRDKKPRCSSDYARAKLRMQDCKTREDLTIGVTSNPLGYFSQSEWLALCASFDHRCACCRQSRKLTADHIVPITKGGTNDIFNIQPLCRSCNSRKGTKIIRYPTLTSMQAILKMTPA